MDATNASNSAASQRPGTQGGADSHDEPFCFGRRPTARAPFPFTEREFARLLILRGRLQALDSSWQEAA